MTLLQMTNHSTMLYGLVFELLRFKLFFIPFVRTVGAGLVPARKNSPIPIIQDVNIIIGNCRAGTRLASLYLGMEELMH